MSEGKIMKKTILTILILLTFFLTSCQEIGDFINFVKEQPDPSDKQVVNTETDQVIQSDESTITTETTKKITENRTRTSQIISTTSRPQRLTQETSASNTQPQRTNPPQTRATTTQAPTTTPTTTESSDPGVGPYWDYEKSDQLYSMMWDFGNEMNQAYFEYWQGYSVDLYGLLIPDDVMGSHRMWDIAFDGQTVDIEWSLDGVSYYGEYALVAIYSDAETQPYLEQHVYFFTIKDGVPKVMITMQNEYIDGRLHFYETENHFLREKFNDIVYDRGYTSIYP